MTRPKKQGDAVKSRLSREDWLSRALDALADAGGGALTIDALTQRLGVSRGSFYWHFKDRADFVRQLIDHWSVLMTQRVTEETAQLDAGPKERLLALMENLIAGQFNRYDMVVRVWAAHDRKAARLVENVDELRLAYVRSLFAEMGFIGDELEMRTRTFVVYYSVEPGLFAPLPRKALKKDLMLRHALLTRP